MKKIFLFVFALISAINLFAHDFASVNSSGDTIYYNILSSSTPYSVAVTYKGAFSLTDSNEYTGSLIIPDTVSYNGITYSVNSINTYAFCFCTKLISVVIPNSVTSIGNYAFYNCSSLGDVTIGNSVTTIGHIAFQLCSKLKTILIPNSVTDIGHQAFGGCVSMDSVYLGSSLNYINNSAFDGCVILSSINVDPDNTTYFSDEGILYKQDTLYLCPKGKTWINKIPNSITTIGSSAFSNCSGLTSFIIPNSITSIGKLAFSNCTNLSSIIIPNSITTIELGAFSNCSSLTSIYIPYSVISIGSNVFGACRNLSSIDVDTNNSIYSSINGFLYRADTLILCPQGKQGVINIPDNTKYIGKHSFSNCEKLNVIIIPDSVISIGDYAFSFCSVLDSVVIGESVISLGESAFWMDTSLTSITLGRSVNRIGEYAFQSCYKLMLIVFKGSIPPIAGSTVFYGTRLDMVLKVPCNSVSRYQTTPIWSYYYYILGVSDTIINYALCDGQIYDQNGFYEELPGVYTKYFQTVEWCDSTITLNLSVNPTPTPPTPVVVSVLGDNFEIMWNGNGTSYEVFKNDSLITITDNLSYIDSNIVSDSEYCYKIKAVIVDCKSELSNPVCKKYVDLVDVTSEYGRVDVYPNPAKDFVLVDIEADRFVEADIEIYDLGGRMVKSSKLSAKVGNRIDVSDLKAGVYSYRVALNGKGVSGKIVIGE